MVVNQEYKTHIYRVLQDMLGMQCRDAIFPSIMKGQPLSPSPVQAGCKFCPAYHNKGVCNVCCRMVGEHGTCTDIYDAPCVAWYSLEFELEARSVIPPPPAPRGAAAPKNVY